VAQIHALTRHIFGVDSQKSSQADQGIAQLIYYLITGEFLSQILCWLNYLYADKLLSTQIDKVAHADKAAEYLVFLHNAIKKIQDEKNQILILGIVRTNYDLLRQESEAAELILTNHTEQAENSKEDRYPRQRREFQLLIELSNYWLKTFAEKETLHLIRANVLFTELGNRWESVKSLLYVTKN